MITTLKKQAKGGRHDSKRVTYIDDDVDIFGQRRTLWKVALKNHPYAVPWVMDNAFNGCMICLASFSFTLWRHHCRVCGYLVCHACSPTRVYIDSIRESNGSRICEVCQKDAVPLKPDYKSHGSNAAMLAHAITVNQSPQKKPQLRSSRRVGSQSFSSHSSRSQIAPTRSRTMSDDFKPLAPEPLDVSETIKEIESSPITINKAPSSRRSSRQFEAQVDVASKLENNDQPQEAVQVKDQAAIDVTLNEIPKIKTSKSRSNSRSSPEKPVPSQVVEKPVIQSAESTLPRSRCTTPKRSTTPDRREILKPVTPQTQPKTPRKSLDEQQSKSNPSSEIKRSISRNAILKHTPSKHLCHISKFEEAAENGVWEVASTTPTSSIASSTPTSGQDKKSNDRKAAARLAKADASVSKAIRHYGIWEADDMDDDGSMSSYSATATPKGRESGMSYYSTNLSEDWDANDENSVNNRR